MPYTVIPLTDVDTDSPVTASLMTSLRDNDEFLKALFHPSTGHTHDGVSADDGALVSVATDKITKGAVVFSGTVLVAANGITQVILQNARAKSAASRWLIPFIKPKNESDADAHNIRANIGTAFDSATTWDIILYLINSSATGDLNIDYEVIEIVA